MDPLVTKPPRTIKGGKFGFTPTAQNQFEAFCNKVTKNKAYRCENK